MTLSNYSPVHASTGQPVNSKLTWSDDATSDSYEVYFGTSQTDVTNKASSVYRSNVETKEYDPRVTLLYSTVYYWRIIAKKSGSADVDSGVKSFTTLAATANIPPASNYRKRLCAVSGTKFYYENNDTPPAMTELSGLTLDVNTAVSMTDYQQKVYIVNGAIKKIVDFMNVKLTVSAMTNVPYRGAILTQATSGAQMTVDFVDSAKTAIYGRVTTAAAFDTSHAVTGGGMDSKTPSAVTLPTTPHYYDWTVYAGDTTSYGLIPTYATRVSKYRNRLCLSGDTANPHVGNQSRQDNPYDWLYMADDVQSPVATTNTEAGGVGDIITAQIPYKDDFILYAAIGEIWIQSGDLAAGGTLNLLSSVIGIVSDTAWCKDASNNLYVCDIKGVYKIPSSMDSFPIPLTQQKLPKFSHDLNLNPKVQKIVLAYDPTRNSLNLCVTNIETGVNQNYYYDLFTEGWFPETYPEESAVYCAHFYDSDEADYRQLLFGTRDGHIRIFDDTVKSDDKGTLASPSREAINSYVLIGPVSIGMGYDYDGVLNDWNIITAGGAVNGSVGDTDSIDYGIYANRSAEEIIEAVDAVTPRVSGTITGPGRSFRKRDRVRGSFMAFKIGNDTLDETWGIEMLLSNILQVGRTR